MLTSLFCLYFRSVVQQLLVAMYCYDCCWDFIYSRISLADWSEYDFIVWKIFLKNCQQICTSAGVLNWGKFALEETLAFQGIAFWWVNQGWLHDGTQQWTRHFGTNHWLLNCIFHRYYCSLSLHVSVCNKSVHVCGLQWMKRCGYSKLLNAMYELWTDSVKTKQAQLPQR